MGQDSQFVPGILIAVLPPPFIHSCPLELEIGELSDESYIHSTTARKQGQCESNRRHWFGQILEVSYCFRKGGGAGGSRAPSGRCRIFAMCCAILAELSRTRAVHVVFYSVPCCVSLHGNGGTPCAEHTLCANSALFGPPNPKYTQSELRTGHHTRISVCLPLFVMGMCEKCWCVFFGAFCRPFCCMSSIFSGFIVPAFDTPVRTVYVSGSLQLK